MKPLAILATDPHFDKDNIEEVSDVLYQLIDVCNVYSCKRIFLLGDVFTNRTGQTLQILLAFRDFLNKCFENEIKVYAIAGNHDKTDLDSEYSYLTVFDSYQGFKLYSKESILTIDGINCVFLSYFLEEGSYLKRLERITNKLPEEGKNYLFTHIAFDGVTNNDGSKVSNGLKSELVSKYDKVFVGHYHNSSVVGKNIYYIGSTKASNFGEDNEKGFTILHKDGFHELHKSNFKKYIKISVNASEKLAIEKLKKKFSKSDNNIRFVVRGTEEELATIDRREFSKLGIDLKKEEVNIVKSIKAAENSEFVDFDKKEISKSFVRYCASNSIKGEKFKMGMKYLSQL